LTGNFELNNLIANFLSNIGGKVKYGIDSLWMEVGKNSIKRGKVIVQATK